MDGDISDDIASDLKACSCMGGGRSETGRDGGAGGKPDTGRPGIKSGGGRGIGTACTFNGSFHGNGTDGKGSG